MGRFKELHIQVIENANIMCLYLKKEAALSVAEKLGYSDECIEFIKNASSKRDLESIDNVMAAERRRLNYA